MSAGLTRITTQKPVAQNGNSISVSLTKEFRALGVKPGDWVTITISKIKPEEETEPEYSME